jgi:hypothetical protein
MPNGCRIGGVRSAPFVSPFSTSSREGTIAMLDGQPEIETDDLARAWPYAGKVFA